MISIVVFSLLFKVLLFLSLICRIAYAVDFEPSWQRHAAVRPMDERLNQYLLHTAANVGLEEDFKNLSPQLLHDWFSPFLKNKSERPAFRSQYLLELFTNLHDTVPDRGAKDRLANIQHYWMSSQNRHMPLSKHRIAGIDEQRVMVNALDRHVNRLIGQYYSAEIELDNIFQLIIGDLADTYLGKTGGTTNLRHKKHYKFCYLISALMVVEKLQSGKWDAPVRDVILSLIPEKVDDAMITRAKALMGLADKTPQASLAYKAYLERNFRIQVKTDEIPEVVFSLVRVAPPMPRSIVTAPAEPLRSFDDLEMALSSFSGLSAVEKKPIEEAFGITEYKAVTQMIALKNQGDGQATAWFKAYGQNYKASYPELFVEAPIAAPKPPVVSTPVVSEDAKRKFLADAKESGRESYTTEGGQQLFLYEVLADGTCGLYSLSIRREAGHAKVQELLRKLAAHTLSAADLPAQILAIPGKADQLLRDAAQQLSAKDYNEHVAIPTLRVLAYSMLRSNVKVWTNDYGGFEEDAADYRWQTERLPTIHLMLKGAHYDNLVPAANVVARMKARAVEDTLPRARELVQQAWAADGGGNFAKKQALQRQAADLQFNAAATSSAQ